MGRGEKFYKYQSFKRDISLSFTIVAQSEQELYGMYKKLNYLASSLAPKYTTAGFMYLNKLDLFQALHMISLQNPHGKLTMEV